MVRSVERGFPERTGRQAAASAAKPCRRHDWNRRLARSLGTPERQPVLPCGNMCDDPCRAELMCERAPQPTVSAAARCVRNPALRLAAMHRFVTREFAAGLGVTEHWPRASWVVFRSSYVKDEMLERLASLLSPRCVYGYPQPPPSPQKALGPSHRPTDAELQSWAPVGQTSCCLRTEY